MNNTKNGGDIPWNSLLNLQANAGIQGPFQTGFVKNIDGNGITILLYNNFDLNADVVPFVGLPYIDFGAYEDLGIIAGYSKDLTAFIPQDVLTAIYLSQLSVGANFKFVRRYKLENHTMDVLTAANLGDELNNSNQGILAGNSIGMDLGILAKSYQLGIGDLGVGIVLRDLFLPFSWEEESVNPFLQKMTNTVTNVSSFAPAFDIGFSYKFPDLSFILSDNFFYLDFANLTANMNFLNKIKYGIEVRLFKVIPIRLGINAGWPSIGLGLEIPILKINLAYYTDELGIYPGNNPEQKIVADIDLMIF